MPSPSPNSEVQEPEVVTVSGRFLGDICQGLTVHPGDIHFNRLGRMAEMLTQLAHAMKGRSACRQSLELCQAEIDELTLGKKS